MTSLRGVTPERAVEWFIVSNLAFLGLDILAAHQENRFEHDAEWAPVVFSGLATLALLPMSLGNRSTGWRVVDRVVAAGAIVVGVTGMVLHLKSAFFEEQTLGNLVYSAPFLAPLAYVGVGLLLLLVRLEAPESPAFGWWIVLLALGGFIGNFGMSLLDHAQNGLFHWSEWIPVISAAFAVGFLLVVLVRWQAALVRITYGVLAVQGVVGILGFVLHVSADLGRHDVPLGARFVFGAPAFAPLLFADLAVLAVLGLWALSRTQVPASVGVEGGIDRGAGPHAKDPFGKEAGGTLAGGLRYGIGDTMSSGRRSNDRKVGSGASREPDACLRPHVSPRAASCPRGARPSARRARA